MAINENYLEEINIVIESYEGFEDNDLYVKKEYVYVNGEQIESNGNHLLAVLEYLGYNATVEWYD